MVFWLWLYICLKVLPFTSRSCSVGVTWNWNGLGHGQWDRCKAVQKVEKKEKPDIMPSGEGADGHRKNKAPRRHEKCRAAHTHFWSKWSLEGLSFTGSGMKTAREVVSAGLFLQLHVIFLQTTDLLPFHGDSSDVVRYQSSLTAAKKTSISNAKWLKGGRMAEAKVLFSQCLV